MLLGASVMPCDTLGHNQTNKKICHVKVSATVSGTTCTVATPDPDPVTLSGRNYARIVWHLDQNFGFCSGDGIAPKTTSTQFSNGAATDDDNGGDPQNPGSCKKNFRLDDENSDTNTYRYALTFHQRAGDGAGVPCTIDPSIVNG